MQQYLEAGKVVTTHGVRGEMKLELWCDGVDFLKKTGRLYPKGGGFVSPPPPAGGGGGGAPGGGCGCGWRPRSSIEKNVVLRPQ